MTRQLVAVLGFILLALSVSETVAISWTHLETPLRKDRLTITKHYLGKGVQLLCLKPSSDEQLIAYQWEKPEGVVVARGSDFTLDKVTASDAGAYVCRAKAFVNGKLVEETSTAHIEYTDVQKSIRAAQSLSPPAKVIITQGNYMEITANEFLRAECLVQGEEQENYDVKWYNPQQNPIGFNGILYVPVEDIDEVVGEYKCEATHRGSQVKISDTLRVVVAGAQQQESPSNFIVQIERQDANRLRCHTVPNMAAAQYEWYINGELVSNVPLLIVNDLDDGRHYSCKVRSHSYIKWSNISQQIGDRDSSFLRGEGGYATLVIGTRHRLICEVNDPRSTPSQIEWYFERQPLLQLELRSSTIQAVVTSKWSELILVKVDQQNAGYYECRTPSGLSKSLLVTVIRAGDVNAVQISGVTSAVEEGEQVKLTCRANRQVGLQWFFLGLEPNGPQQALPSGWLVQSTEGDTSWIRLERVRSTDRGYYQCITTQGAAAVFLLQVNHRELERQIEVSVSTKLVRVRANEDARIECTVKKFGQLQGEPRWRFSRSNQTLRSSSKFQITHISPGISQLLITNVQFNDDAMQLECYFEDVLDAFTLQVEREEYDECLLMGNFRCASGRCISRDNLCNGVDECGDRSDENQYSCSNQTRRVEVSISPQELRLRPGSSGFFECTSRMNEQLYGALQWRFRNQQLPISATDGRFQVTESSVGRSILSFFGLREADNEMQIECFLPEASATAVVYVQSSSCGVNEFRCRNGQCIPRARYCDKRRDCSDNSDEDSCSTSTQFCDPLEIKCEPNDRGELPTRQFFSPSWRCDGENDCGNLFDELNCEVEECSSRRFECSAGGQSIPKAFLCDKESDCPSGQDELNCRSMQILRSDRLVRRVPLGDTVHVKCTVIGRPLPAVIWRFNWNCLRDASRMSVINRSVDACTQVESTLVIRNFQPGDAGIYNCEALTSQHRVISDDYQILLQQ